jgi:hypothetical protein
MYFIIGFDMIVSAAKEIKDSEVSDVPDPQRPELAWRSGGAA